MSISFNSALTLALGVASLGAGPGATSAGGQLPQAALATVTKLTASKMGVDREGNLWAWNAANGDLKVISPQGEEVGRYRLPGAFSVDADREWGAVALVDVQRTIAWLRQGVAEVRLPLSGPAADICWLGPSTVAVTPQLAAQRIELWDLTKGEVIGTVGSGTPLEPAIGATRLPSVLLRYDFEREILYSLESFTGDLRAFRRNGEVAWRAEAENPDRETWETWLRDLDQRAKAERDRQTPTIFSLRLALGPGGEVWTAQKRLLGDEPVTMVKLDAKGNQSMVLKDASCRSRDFVIWRDQIIFFRDPRAPQGGCVSATTFR